MIDYLALLLTHALIMIALLRVLGRPELDSEEALADEPEGDPAQPPRGRTRASRRRSRRA